MHSVTAQNVILLTNGLASLLSGGSSIVGMIKPGVALPGGEPVNGGVRLYAYAYGARAVPLAAVTIALIAMGDRSALVPVLAIAGLAQAGDSAIGVRQRNKGMAIGAGLCAVLHLASAWWFHAY